MLYSKTAPYLSKIKKRFLLNKTGSSKQTYHVVLDLEGSDLEFEVGDSIAILPQNDPRLVDHLLHALQATGSEIIKDQRNQDSLPIREFLTKRANLSRLNASFLQLIHCQCLDNPFSFLLQKENRHLLNDYLKNHSLLQMLEEHRQVKLPLEEFCATLSPLLPRFYSIASSPLLHPNEVHLTVSLFTFAEGDQKKFGVASHFLCHLANEETTVPIYVQKSHGFTLPLEDHVPIIMIGPGTGIAPFRAFLQERLHREASGKNWVFFGERNRSCDFFYEDFFQDLQEKSFARISTAFSRDQEEKIYVQHRLLEHKEEIWKWIQEGANIYVCGDATRMAKDVEATLQNIIKEKNSFSDEESRAFIKSLRAQKRYLLDVY